MGAARPHLEGVVALGPQRRYRQLLHLLPLGNRDAAQNDIHAVVLPLCHGKALLYDENLDEFYDYEGYALQRMNEEDGMFTDRGYIAYKGYISLAEIMDGSQSSRMEMGGMA